MKTDVSTRLMWLALPVFLLAGVLSSGFHHFDEHYQVLEFARYFITGDGYDTLPWEYHARIRPALQPLLASGILSITKGWEPWYQAMLIRVLMSLTVLLVLKRYLKTWLEEQGPARAVHYTIWVLFAYLIPFLSARFSAEVFGSVFMLLALAEHKNDKPNSPIIAGLWLALAVVARLQMVSLVAGFGLWLLIIQRPGLRHVLLLAAGFALGTALGILADRLFYGELCLTAYRYFEVNVLLNKSAEFGVHAWSYYFTLPLKMGLLSVLNGLLFLSALWFFIRHPRHVLTWSLIPFILAHVVVPHKELRFLFPVFFFLPLMLVWSSFDLLKKRAVWLLGALLLINLPVMLWKAVTPANGQPLLYHRLDELGARDTIYAAARGTDLLQSQAGLNMPFYQKNRSIVLLDSSRLAEPGPVAWLCMWPGQGVPEVYHFQGRLLPGFLWELHRRFRIPVNNAEWVIYRQPVR